MTTKGFESALAVRVSRIREMFENSSNQRRGGLSHRPNDS